MNKTIQELVPLIQEWAKERGIFDKSTPFDQLLKTHEEVGELIKACYDNDKPAIQDAIGDTMICLINYCYMVEDDSEHVINEGLTMEPDKIAAKVRLAIHVGMVLSEILRFEYKRKRPPLYCFPCFIRGLNSIVLLENTTLEECLNIAYNEIKNRTGKMINGKFVKDEK